MAELDTKRYACKAYASDELCSALNSGRPTAEKTTVDALIRSFKTNSIDAHLARAGSNYGGNSTKFMNQWFRLNGYSLADVESVQLEFGYEEIRRSEDLGEASQNISNALSVLNDT